MNRNRRTRKRSGLSLLEVMLALSILGISTAILSRILQLGSDNGLRARRLTQAQLLCESKLNELIASGSPSATPSWSPMVSGTANQEWYFMVQQVAAEQKGLVGFAVLINDSQGVKESSRPLAKLVQLIPDPSLQIDVKTITAPAGSSTTSGTSTGSSASGTAGGSGGVQ